MKKCVGCSDKFQYTIKYKSKNYCPNCHNKLMNSKTNCSICKKSYVRADEYTCDSMENKDKNKNFCSLQCYQTLLKDRVDMEELDKWLKEYHKTEKLNSRIYMQIQQFKSKNGFTYKGILLTLQYVVNTLKKDLELDTIGLVAWYYDTAKEEYIKNINKQQRLEMVSSDFKMFQVSKSKPKIIKYSDNREKKILITEIEFDTD